MSETFLRRSLKVVAILRAGGKETRLGVGSLRHGFFYTV